jgi:uncharacterized membrane protein YtjA (UPF0391 family)
MCPAKSSVSNREKVMLSWALTFLVVALIAGLLGFGLIQGISLTIAKILFFVFLVLFVLSLIGGMNRRVT